MTSEIRAIEPGFNVVSHQPEVFFASVSPAVALEWLEKHNTHNRNVAETRVDQYTRDMNAGRWHLGTDGIGFDRDGVLRNGQHRLLSVISSGITQVFIVVLGLDPKSQTTMDNHFRRTVAGQAQIKGFKNTQALSAIANLVLTYQRSTSSALGVGARPTNPEALEFIEQTPFLEEATRIAMRVRMSREVKKDIAIGAAFFICAELDKEAAYEFYENQIAEGVGLTRESPAKVARDYLSRMNKSTHSKDVLQPVLKAWNAWRQGVPVQKLRKVAPPQPKVRPL